MGKTMSLIFAPNIRVFSVDFDQRTFNALASAITHTNTQMNKKKVSHPSNKVLNVVPTSAKYIIWFNFSTWFHIYVVVNTAQRNHTFCFCYFPRLLFCSICFICCRRFLCFATLQSGAVCCWYCWYTYNWVVCVRKLILFDTCMHTLIWSFILLRCLFGTHTRTAVERYVSVCSLSLVLHASVQTSIEYTLIHIIYLQLYNAYETVTATTTTTTPSTKAATVIQLTMTTIILMVCFGNDIQRRKYTKQKSEEEWKK